MAYDWSELDISKITSLYLYGTETPPSNLLDDALIRPDQPSRIEVNMASFMESGPGRFALGSESALVQAFFETFSGHDLKAFPWIEAGREYTKQEIAGLLIANGIPSLVNSKGEPYYGIDIHQANLDDGAGDYVTRTYVWNSGGFKISDQSRFAIDPDGYLHIKNFSVAPRGGEYQENFDFSGGGLIAKITNQRGRSELKNLITLTHFNMQVIAEQRGF